VRAVLVCVVLSTAGFQNAATLSGDFGKIAPFSAGILNVHCAPQCTNLVSGVSSCISIGLITRKTSSTFRRLFNPQPRFQWGFNFSEQ